jgi:hypothetical protein
MLQFNGDAVGCSWISRNDLAQHQQPTLLELVAEGQQAGLRRFRNDKNVWTPEFPVLFLSAVRSASNAA